MKIGQNLCPAAAREGVALLHGNCNVSHLMVRGLCGHNVGYWDYYWSGFLRKQKHRSHAQTKVRPLAQIIFSKSLPQMVHEHVEFM